MKLDAFGQSLATKQPDLAVGRDMVGAHVVLCIVNDQGKICEQIPHLKVIALHSENGVLQVRPALFEIAMYLPQALRIANVIGNQPQFFGAGAHSTQPLSQISMRRRISLCCSNMACSCRCSNMSVTGASDAYM